MKTVFKYTFKNKTELKFFLATLGLWGNNRWSLFLKEITKRLKDEQVSMEASQWEVVLLKKLP